MARGQDEFSDMSEARRHLSSHDEDEADAAERDDASPEEEGKSRGRSEGLDTLKCYLREIRRSTLLTFKQEQQLGKRVMAGDEQARQQMIESNLRLVISIGKRYIHRGFPFSDIVEEGNLGLNQGRRKIQLQARVPLQYLRLLVDQAVHRTGDHQSGQARAFAGARRRAAQSVSRQGRGLGAGARTGADAQKWRPKNEDDRRRGVGSQADRPYDLFVGQSDQ